MSDAYVLCKHPRKATDPPGQLCPACVQVMRETTAKLAKAFAPVMRELKLSFRPRAQKS